MGFLCLSCVWVVVVAVMDSRKYVRSRERVRRRVVEDEDGGEESGSGEERGFFSIIE